ncbi:hypothetical protein ACFV2N_06710 [Streptomyces sp. NPDC059680]|uniref:hypothetical protein n=1 Tax=Streptomyces sp. NPDC059680 TaxID=3346904 RepID=UPI0036B98B78
MPCPRPIPTRRPYPLRELGLDRPALPGRRGYGDQLPLGRRFNKLAVTREGVRDGIARKAL